MRVDAAGVNVIDIYRRSRYKIPVPLAPGREGAGAVEAVGAGVPNLSVAWAAVAGSYATYVLATPADIGPVPVCFDLRGPTREELLWRASGRPVVVDPERQAEALYRALAQPPGSGAAQHGLDSRMTAGKLLTER